MSNRKPPSSAPTAPGRTRPSTPPEQNKPAGANQAARNQPNGVAKPAGGDDAQTQQIPRVSDEKGSPSPAKSGTAPARQAPPPAKSAPAKAAQQPASSTPAPKTPESRSGVPTAGTIAADAETTKTSAGPAETTSTKSRKSSTPKVEQTPAPSTPSRKARLRLVRFDPWSVMKTAFALSIALAIVTVVAVTIVWAVLDVAGVWDAINSSVATILSDNSDAFDVTDYVGFGRIIGFTILIAAIDVILITAIATIGAFLYNLAASLLGGLEITLAEDN